MHIKVIYLPRKIRLQIFYILIKSINTCRCDFADCLRIIFPELLVDFNISGFPEFLNLYTQVTCCCTRLLLQKRKLRLLQH